MIKFVFTRYVFYGFIALEILIMPKLLPSSIYGEFEYAKYLSNTLPLILLGTHSGYMYNRYSKNRDDYTSLFLVGLILLFVTGFFASIFLSNWLYLISTLSIGSSFILEKKLLVEKKFTTAILFKPLLSLTFIGSIGVAYYLGNVGKNYFLAMSVAYTFSLILYLRFADSDWKSRIFIPQKKHIKEYIDLLKVGFTLNLGTIVYTLYLFFDRYYIKTYLNEELAGYSIAFNFAQMVVIGLSSIGLLTSVQLGENSQNLTKKLLNSILKKSTLIFLALGIGGGLGIVFYEYLIGNYSNLLPLYILVLSINGVFFLLGSVSSVVFYKGNQLSLSLSFLLIFIINLSCSELMMKFQIGNIHLFLAKSFLFMLVYVGVGYFHIRKITKGLTE